MRLHKEAYGEIVQTNAESVTEIFENIGVVAPSKLMQLRKSPSRELVEKILRLEAFKDIKQHIVRKTGTESTMSTMSTMLAVVSTVREVGLKRHFYRYSASISGCSFSTVH